MVSVSPELTVKDVTVQVLVPPFQVPPIDVQDAESDIVPPVALASGMEKYRTENITRERMRILFMHRTPSSILLSIVYPSQLCVFSSKLITIGELAV